MPYPSPITYPSGMLFPGVGVAGNQGRSLIAFGDLLLNRVDEDGTVWAVEENPGWLGSPASTADATQRARGHGVTTSEGFLEGKVLPMKGRIRADSPEALSLAIDRLNAAVSLEPFHLMVTESGRIRHMQVQRQDEVLVSNPRGSSTVAVFSIQLLAKDPRKFGDLITASTRLPFSTGGLIRPSTWPRTWTGVSGTGKITVHNAGNTQAPVWLRVEGPLPAGGHSVTHEGKRQTVTFGTALALGAGEFLTVDMDRREVLAQGQAPRSGYVTSRGWFSLDPGVNVISFSSANYSETANLSLSTKPAWS